MGRPHKAESKLTCKQRLLKLKQNKSYNNIRRSWWNRVRRNEPLLAQNVSTGLGRTMQDLDDTFGHAEDTWSARRWQLKKEA